MLLVLLMAQVGIVGGVTAVTFPVLNPLPRGFGRGAFPGFTPQSFQLWVCIRMYVGCIPKAEMLHSKRLRAF